MGPDGLYGYDKIVVKSLNDQAKRKSDSHDNLICSFLCFVKGSLPNAWYRYVSYVLLYDSWWLVGMGESYVQWFKFVIGVERPSKIKLRVT